ncbi:DNA sulfur modification protein DndB [Agromyces flavus]|uniref:DNA sulfur modification protein DndB n=2 Tax=Agromyces flavus TaxID=589382 RepID=A0ABT1KGS0_9MICO|nr:DGQHR domain-containing protein [Agromyces flavus]MCP2366070.1 DNA sulfur modification protein DndB [Agromyces flavus]GGI43939.1 hypothetical protein GCM10010932_02100 [Agromyces flavus]
MTTVELDLLPATQLRAATARRLSRDLREKVPLARQGEYEANGWVVDKVLKSAVWMRRPKSHGLAFEDRVWAMCARLGFSSMNRTRELKIRYGKSDNETKQLDVFAADDDVVLVIECKSSDKDQAPTYAFKTEIESIQGYRKGVTRQLRELFPDHKVKFVFATNNIGVSEETRERISNADIAYLDEESVAYYHELADHLGVAAKYQFLGNLFQGDKIQAMDATVAAIQGKMGGHTYYSFAIEPDRLLKLAYVLHRNNANSQWMPTYQRVIKRSRLKRVTEFVGRGGFFPNSLIINIETGRRGLRFERATTQAGESRLGVLHLPQKYRSAYVIDGQHRLYGFANSARANTELLPVVAFVDLPGDKQLELFMQINENQQAVPKNLRLTLKADLEWTSIDLRRRAQALKLKVAQQLGERKSSPLRGRVILGEEKSTDRLCITLDAINRGIDRGRFIGEFTSSEMKKVGSFYRGSNEATLRPLTEFLEYCFDHARDRLPLQWNAGKGEGGFVFTNPGTEAMLRVVGDIVDFLADQGKLDARVNTPKETFAQVREILDPLLNHLAPLSVEDIAEFKSWFGSGGPTKYLRRFQAALVECVDGFMPDGFDEWKANQEKQFNQESYSMINDIENHMKQDIRRRLQDRFRGTWIKDGVPKAVYARAESLRAEKQYEAPEGVTVDWWDCLYLIDYHSIMQQGSKALWDEIYDEAYTLPSDRKAGAWKSKLSWVVTLNEVRKKTHHSGGEAVTEEEYAFLQTLHSHFDLGGTGRND